MQSALAPSGSLRLHVSRPAPSTFWDRLSAALPWPSLPADVRAWRVRNLTHTIPGFAKLALAVAVSRLTGIPALYGTLALRLRTPHGVVDFGVASVRVVTTAGVGFIVDAFQNSVEVENMKYHGFGTGANAEASGDTALQTELTTQYATDDTRPTGTTTEGASANIYRTVATLSPNAGGTIAVTEHGVFDQAANSGGVLLDRSVFSAVNVVASSDSLQATYELTFTAGS